MKSPGGHLSAFSRFTSSVARIFGRRHRTILLASLAGEILIGGVLALHQGSAPHSTDERDYLLLSQHFKAGKGFTLDGTHPTAFRAPTWPITLGLLRFLGIHGVGLRLIAVLCLATTVLLAYLIGCRLAGPAAGALAALASSAYPLSVYAASTLYPETESATLLLLSVWLALIAVDASASETRRRWLPVLGFGLASGLLALNQPTLIPTSIALAVWLCGSGGRARQVAVVAGLTAIVPILMWTARNEASLHSPVVLTDGSGLNLLLGNSELARYDTGSSTNIEKYKSQATEAGLTSPDHEPELDGFYRKRALQWISRHPGHAARLYVQKALYYFAPYNAPVAGRPPTAAARLAALLTFPALMAVLAIQLLRLRWRGLIPLERVLIGAFLLNALFFAVFFTRVRFRLPLDELAIVAVAAATLRVTSDLS